MFREDPRSAEVFEDDEVVLRCKPPKGNPKPAITWYKNDVALNNDPEETIKSLNFKEDYFENLANKDIGIKKDSIKIRRGVLKIAKAQLFDSGVFYCVASNIAATIESKRAVLQVKGYNPY